MFRAPSSPAAEGGRAVHPVDDRPEGEHVVGLGLGERLDDLIHVGTHRHLGDVYVPVRLSDHAEVLLARGLAPSGELGDSRSRGRFGCLPTGVRVDLGVEHEDVDIAPQRHHVIEARHGVRQAADEATGLAVRAAVLAEARERFEQPVAHLAAAHRAIESLTLDRGAAHLKDELIQDGSSLRIANNVMDPIEQMEDDVLAVINGRGDVRLEIETPELGGLAYRVNQLINLYTGVAEEDDEGRAVTSSGGWEAVGTTGPGSAAEESVPSEA